MANNRLRVQGRQIRGTVTSGGSTSANGLPTAIGNLLGVSLTPTDGDGNAVIDTMGVYSLAVHGTNAGGNHAINQGDSVYYDSGTGNLSADSTKALFGIAIGNMPAPGGGGVSNPVVASGATTTIPVKLIGSN